MFDPALPAESARSHLAPAALRIVDAVLDALSDRNLPAGGKLGEELLARLFETSRTTVRQALQHLRFLGIVEIEPNRGASIARPTARMAADLYAARRAIESQTVADAARYCTANDMRRMLAHIERQDAAATAKNRRELVRLRGEFHLVIAEIGGNAVLCHLLGQILPRCALIRALADPQPFSKRQIDEHRMLAQLIAKGDAKKATALVQSHLQINEQQLRFSGDDQARANNVDVWLGAYARPHPAERKA